MRLIINHFLTKSLMGQQCAFVLGELYALPKNNLHINNYYIRVITHKVITYRRSDTVITVSKYEQTR